MIHSHRYKGSENQTEGYKGSKRENHISRKENRSLKIFLPLWTSKNTRIIIPAGAFL